MPAGPDEEEGDDIFRNNGRLLFALDFDDTYTLNPGMWNDVIRTIRAQGYLVFVVTMRDEHNPAETQSVRDALSGRVDRIIFTSRKAKKRHMAFLGHYVHVWIDDRPEFILGDAARAA